MLAKVKCVIVGGGVVGLAVGRALSMKGVEVLLCERNGHIGMETSSRNSEVIHAGMYYTPGSNKARFCVEGMNLLYKYMKERGVEHNMCGKLILAQNETEHKKLGVIQEKAVKNGLFDLKFLTKEDVRELEPEIQCHSALLSPRTGIVDSHGYMQALLGDFEESESGGMTVYNCDVLGVKRSPDAGSRYAVKTNQGVIGCDILINAAGLHAVDVASVIEPYPSSRLPKSYFCKGNYFKYQPPIAAVNAHSAAGVAGTLGAVAVAKPGSRPRSKLFRHLLYPIPPTEHTGLGVHSTIDLNGSVKFGPDTEWMRPPPHLASSDTSNPDREFEFVPQPPRSDSDGDAPTQSAILGAALPYRVDPTRCESFYEAIRRYYPGLPDDSLVPDYAGIRAKLCGPSGHQPSPTGSIDTTDFYIESEQQHGLPGLVQLYGLESPALTSSLAIADYVCSLVDMHR